MFKKILLLAFLVTSTSAKATDVFVTIQDFELWTNTYFKHQIRVITDAPIVNPGNCANEESYMVGVSLPQASQSRMFSTLLAAVVAKKSVKLVINGCTYDRPRITTVIIK